MTRLIKVVVMALTPSSLVGVLRRTWPLLHYNGQIHASVNRTIEVIHASSSKRTNVYRAASDRYIDHRRSRLRTALRRAVSLPGTIAQHMLIIGIINQAQFGTLRYKHHILH